MGLVAAKCTQCGSNIEVDESKEAGICPHCGTAFITEKAVHNYYNTVNNTYQNHIAHAHIDHAVFQDRESAESLAADFFKLYDLNERSAADRIREKMYENYPQRGLTYLCSACSRKASWIWLAERRAADEKQTEIKDAYYFDYNVGNYLIDIKQDVESAEKLMTPDEKQQFAGRLEDLNEFCKQMQRRKEDYERLKKEENERIEEEKRRKEAEERFRRSAENYAREQRQQEAQKQTERKARQEKNKRTTQNIIFIVCLIGFILLVVFALSQCYNCLTDF